MMHNCVAMLLFLLCLVLECGSTTKISFDVDIDDNCMERIADCTTDAALWNTCPIACAKSLEPPVAVDFSNIDSDDFLALKAKDINDKMIRFSNYDGYATLVVTVPALLVPFHYAMLEHLQGIYPYVLEILMIPVENAQKKKKKKKKDHVLETKQNGKVIVLGEADQVLDYFTKKLLKVVNDTYATGFLFSVDDDFLQVHHSPNINTLKEHIRKDLIQLEGHEPEF